MQGTFAKYIITAAFVASTVIADPTEVTVFEHANYKGISHSFDSHNDCTLLPREFRPIVSSFTRDKHWYKVRLWQGANCEGENEAYQTSFRDEHRQWSWPYVGDKMNDKVVSVSTCKESLNNECHAYKACILGEMVAGSVATTFLSIFTVGLAAIPGAIVTAGASAASWAAFYNGECRFCFGRAADDLVAQRHQKRDFSPDTPVTCPAFSRNIEGERAIYSDMSKAASSMPLTPTAISELFISYFPGGIAGSHLESVGVRFTQAMMEAADTNEDGAVDSKEVANLHGLWLSTIKE